MGKLGSLLQDLKKSSIRKYPEKKFRLIHLFSCLLFIAAIFGGYILVKVVGKLKSTLHDKAPVSVARKIPFPVTAPAVPESPPRAPEPAIKKEAEPVKKPKAQLPNTSINLNKKQRVPKKETKPIPSRDLKKNITVKRHSEPVLTSPPSSEGPFVLKSKGLRQNLLLNAEGARLRGNIGEAIYFYKEYLKGGTDPDVLNNLGVLYLMQNRYEEAERTFREALKIKSDPVYEFNYCLSLMRMGKKKEACLRLKKNSFPDSLRPNYEELLRECRDE